MSVIFARLCRGKAVAQRSSRLTAGWRTSVRIRPALPSISGTLGGGVVGDGRSRPGQGTPAASRRGRGRALSADHGPGPRGTSGRSSMGGGARRRRTPVPGGQEGAEGVAARRSLVV